MSEVRLAEDDESIRACFSVMRQLRHRLDSADELIERVQRQRAEQCYALAYLIEGNDVVAVAGYRLMENLNAGRTLYVDDLVTDEGHRRKGYAQRLLHWLTEEARRQGCASLDLDSGVQRHGAHKLYMAHGMDIVFYHFRMKV